MRWWLAMAAALGSGPVLAADDSVPRIVVSGTATVLTLPDLATIEFRIVGEGATSDAAVSAMVAKRAAIAAALAPGEMRNGSVRVTAVRGSDCRDDDAEASVRLSAGKCAIAGYIAAMDGSVRLTAVGDAGTLVATLGHLGAWNPRLDGFGLVDPDAAQRRAVTAALVDARRQAEAVAAATSVRLGRLLLASTDQRADARDILVTGTRIGGLSAPIAVTLTPRPIETRAQVTVTYAVAP